MNKKLISALMAVSILSSTGFAAEIKNCNISKEGVVTIKDSLDSKKEGAFVSLMVLRPGVSADSLEENVENSGNVAEFNRTQTKKDGEYTFSFAIDGQSDFYDCIIASDFGDKENFQILFSNPQEAKELIVKLNNAQNKEEFYNLIFGEEEGYKALAFYLSLAENADEKKVSELLYNYVQEEKLDENDTKAAADIYKKLYVTELLNEEKQISIEELEEYLGVLKLEFYKYYDKGYMTDKAKEELYSGLLGKDFETVADFEEAFLEQLVLKTVRFGDGYGNIRDILSDYEEFTGIDTDELKRENYNNVIGKDYSDYSELEDALLKKDSKPSNSGGAGGGGGSKNNSVIGSGTVAIGVNPTDDKKAEPIYYDEIKTNEFSDIKDIAWAKDAINKLSKKGIINGKGDNLFAPYDNITREEFASILVRLLGVNEVSSDINFSDVSDSAWYAKTVKAAAYEGIVMGKGDGSFGVGENITRQDMAVMLYRALKLNEEALEDSKFPDDADIADYAKKAVYGLKEKSVFSGYSDGRFKPNELATRAQAAVVIYRAFSDKF